MSTSCSNPDTPLGHDPGSPDPVNLSPGSNAVTGSADARNEELVFDVQGLKTRHDLRQIVESDLAGRAPKRGSGAVRFTRSVMATVRRCGSITGAALAPGVT